METPSEQKPKKQDLLRAFKADLSAADTLRLEMVAKVETWRNEYNGAKYGNEQKGKSELVSRDIKRQDEWQHASVKDPFVSSANPIRCHPVTFEDRTAAEQSELILNYQFTRQFPRYNFMTNAIKLYYAEGTVIIKTGWNYEDEEVVVPMPVYDTDPSTGMPVQVGVKEVKQLRVKTNQPDAQICRLEDVYLDPTSEGDLDKAQFAIHRYESDISTLRQTGKYKNLKKLAVNLMKDSGDDFDPTDDTEFMFQDQARTKLVVYEYWGNYDVDGDGIAEPIVCTWVNDTIIQLQSNPYPDKKIPFVIAANNSIPFRLHGEAAAELVGDNQKITTAIKRGIIDNMANSNNAQKGIPLGALDNRNKKRFLNGQNFEFNGSKANFYDGSYNQLPASVFDVLNMVNQETESMLGVKSFSGGIAGNTMGNSAAAARGVLDSVAIRRADIVRNIGENIVKQLMRKWMAYNAEFLRPEEIIRITNDEFVEIKRDDLKGQIDIQLEISTAEADASKAETLSFLLQTLGQNLPFPMLKLLMEQIAKLNQLPDLAKSIKEFEPEPDPYQQKMQQLELEEKMANIEERLSRARENAVDVRAKNAKAAVDEARAGNLQADTDMKDLDFTRKARGEEFAERMEEKSFDSLLASMRGSTA